MYGVLFDFDNFEELLLSRVASMLLIILIKQNELPLLFLLFLHTFVMKLQGRATGLHLLPCMNCKY